MRPKQEYEEVNKRQKGFSQSKFREDGINGDATHSMHEGFQGGQNINRWEESNTIRSRDGAEPRTISEDTEWDTSFDFSKFPTQPPICGGDDGLPRELDSITFPKWRKESIMAYGNAIVPQVALQIFKTINKLESSYLKNI